MADTGTLRTFGNMLNQTSAVKKPAKVKQPPSIWGQVMKKMGGLK